MNDSVVLILMFFVCFNVFLHFFVGVFVEVPPVVSEGNTVTLRGPQEKMGEALTLVYGKVLIYMYLK